MNKQEQEFINSIKEKIEKYEIRTTVKEALKNSKNQFIYTVYNTGEKELVDVGVEYFLCKCSALYFISKYCFITVPGMGGKQPAQLYYFQKEIIRQMGDYKKVVFAKSRQLGLSTINALYAFWKAVTCPDEQISIVSKDSKSSQEFLFKIKENIETLPEFFNLKLIVDNVRKISFSNKSTIHAFARSRTATRSVSNSLVILDEVAFFTSDTIVRGIISSAMPSLQVTNGNLILISTANGCVPGSEGYFYYEQVKQLEETGGISPDGTSRLFAIDWWGAPDRIGAKPYKGFNEKLKEFEERDYFNNREVYLEARSFFTPIENKWKENDWLRFQHQTLGDVLFRQEVLRDFVILGNSVFSNEIMDKVKSRAKVPLIKDTLAGRPFKDLWIWKEPQPGRRYCIGSDVSSGTSNDYSSIQVIDVESYEQVAEYIGRCTVQDLANYIKRVGHYYNEAYVIVESNSIGEAVFSNLYYTEDAYHNLFKQQKSRNGITRFTGWITDVKTRQLITNNFIDFFYVDELFENIKIYSERLIGQMSTWINTERGPDHQKSSHDDGIMAFAIGLYNRTKALSTGASFIIDEKGRTVDYSAVTSERKYEDPKGFGIVSSDDKDRFDEIEQKIYEDTNCNLKDYRWLLG